MAITKPPKKTVTPSDDAAEAFISGAPDSATAPKPRRVRKGKRVQITVTMPEQVLERVDQLAENLGQSRASIINLAVTQLLQKGMSFEGIEDN